MGTTTVKLENGQTATIRDPKLITNGQRRPIVQACDRYLKTNLSPELTREIQRAVVMKDVARQNDLLAAAQLGIDEEATLKTGEVFITVMVEAWTLDLPIPADKPIVDDDGFLVGSEVLEELLALDYDRLQIAAASMLNEVRYTGDVPKAPSSSRSRKR